MAWVLAVSKLIPFVVAAVHMVEKISGDKKGKDKQDAAIEAIGAMIQATELGLSKELLDEAELQVLMRKLIDDYVAVQNYVSKWRQTHNG